MAIIPPNNKKIKVFVYVFPSPSNSYRRKGFSMPKTMRGV